MIELSTALKGTENLTRSNLTLATADGTDSRRHTKFDRTASNVASVEDFSFGDLVDMLNPLQHIPVVSSIYRGLTGDTIHPAARVTGDILYGGVIGVASAALGGLGGMADSVMIDKSGNGMGGTMLAVLFEDNPALPPTPPSSTADTNTTAVSTNVAQATLPTSASAPNLLPTEVTPDQLDSVLTTLAQQATITPAVQEPPKTVAQAPATTTTDNLKAYRLETTKSYPLPPRNTLPYGGVMETVQSGIPTNQADSLPLPQPSALPQQLIDDLRALAATRSYQATARGVTPLTIDLAE